MEKDKCHGDNQYFYHQLATASGLKGCLFRRMKISDPSIYLV